MKPIVPAFRASLSPCPTVLVFVALLAFPLQPATAGIAGGDLRVFWTHDPDHPKTLVIHTPAAGYRLLPLDGAESGEHLFHGLPAGILRLDLHTTPPGALQDPADVILAGGSAGLHGYVGRLLESWEVPIGTDRLTTVRLDSSSGWFRVDQASAEPFGNELIWDAWELSALPNHGTEAVLPLDTRAGSVTDPILNGRDLRRQASVRPRALRIDGDPSLVQVPLSGRPATQGSGAMQTATYRASPALVRLQASMGVQQQFTSQGRLSFSSFAGSRSPFEVDAVFNHHNAEDAGPIGILDDRLKGNDLRAMEARARAFARPWGHGLAEMEFYAFGQRRSFYLHEFRLIPERAPRQDRADLLAALAYTLPVRSHTLSLGLSYSRAYLETGDGTAYDRIENYSVDGDPEHNLEASENGLYWSPGETGVLKTHVYNYYTKHVIGTLQMSALGRLALLDHGPMRTGLTYSRSTYRWYEHSDPVTEYSSPRDENGLRPIDYASHLGYSWAPSQRVDSGLHAPPKPAQVVLYASQQFSLGRGSIEAGARLEHFRPGQRPVRTMVEPAGDNEILEGADLGDEPSDTGIDPRIGFHLPVGKGHLWADLVQSRTQPPYEALYYSPNVLRSLDNQIRLSDGSHETISNLIFGNPALGPEVRRGAHLGFRRPLGESWNVTLAGTLARTGDTWVAKAHPNGNSFLYAYDNEGNRRERSVDVGLDYRPGPRTLVRLLYNLSRIETNVIEPAPLYRGLLIPGGPVEGTASRETAPLAPVWTSEGEADEYHPSLFDRTHRIAAVFLARIDGAGLGPALGTLFSGSDFGLTARVASGAPYTPTYVKPAGFMTPVPGERGGTALTPGIIRADAGVNSGRMPWTWTMDMRLRRYIRLWGSNWTADLQVLNLLDRRNVRRVYGATGKADDDGWLDTTEDPRAEDERFAESYRDRLNNPWHYEDGIRARISLSYTY